MKDEYAEIMKILNANADKPFVKRIIGDQTKQPRLDLKDGNYATHRMAWGEADTPSGRKYVVYPTVMTGKDGKLVDHGDKAFSHAVKTNNVIEFDDPKKAEWFSKSYKEAWKSSAPLSPEK